MVLKVWSRDQKYQHHLGIYWKCKFSGITLALLKTLRVRPSVQYFNQLSKSEQASTCSSLRVTNLGKCVPLSEAELGGWLSNLQLFFIFGLVKNLRRQLSLPILWEDRAFLSPRYREM